MSYARSLVAREFQVGEATASDLAQHGLEASVVVQVAQVEGKGALVEVAEQVERLDADVRAMQASLEQRPEVLHAVRMDDPVHVL